MIHKNLVESREGMVLTDSGFDIPGTVRFIGLNGVVDFIPLSSLDWLRAYPSARLVLFVHKWRVLTFKWLMDDDGSVPSPVLYGLVDGKLVEEKMDYAPITSIRMQASKKDSPVGVLQWIECAKVHEEIAA